MILVTHGQPWSEIQRGPPKYQNYLLQGRPLVYRLPPLGECSDLSVSVHQLALLWEAAFSFSEFFLKTLSMHLPVSWWVICECTCPYRTKCSVVSDQKTAWPPRPTLPIHPISGWAAFSCFPGWKKVLRGKRLLTLKKWTKNGRSTERHQNQHVEKLLGAVEKTSPWVYCIKWRALWRWLKFKRKNKHTVFYK